MKLKKLTIIGFKSFAERVVIDFDQEIIGVVGPNGCGKSNIVDAFRWVMGEQSAKSLRGDKMHDVLFAGTDKRKPLNYAEVSVTFTEIQGALLLPYEEITITRRLHRSGESEYFINKEPTRLKDIQSLFLGSGIGKNAFSIFEQGKLDQIINLSPLERRAIFDEAAGTSRFLQRKKETVRKLAAVNENYSRVSDVHAEIEKQTKQLKRQAHQAKNYQDNKTRLSQLEKEVLLFRWHTLTLASSGLEEKKNSLEEQLGAAQARIVEQENAFKEAKQKVYEEELLTKEQHKELSMQETKGRVLEVEVQQQKNRLLESKKREENLRIHLQDLGNEEIELETEKRKKAESLASLDQKKEKRFAELEIKKESYRKLETHLSGLQQKVKQAQTEQMRLMQTENEENRKLHEKTLRHEARTTRLHSLAHLAKGHEERKDQLDNQAETQRKKVEKLTHEIDACKAGLEQAEKEWQSLRKALQEVAQKEQTLSRKMAEVESHQKALTRLQEDMEGFSQGAKLLLKESKSGKSALAGKLEPLFEYVLPKKGYEQLLASSMRPYAETLVVQSDEDLELVIDFAEKKKITDFSIVVAGKISDKKEKPQKNSLAQHITYSPIAYHFTNHSLVAAEGHFFDALGVFFHASSGKKLSSPFQRQAELQSLGAALEELKDKWKDLSQSLEKLSEQLKEAEKKRNEQGEIRRKKEMDLIQQNFTLQQFLGDIEKVKKELMQVQKEKEDLARLAHEEKEIALLKERCETIKKERELLVSSLLSLEESFEKEQKTLKMSREVVQEEENLFYEAKSSWLRVQQEMDILAAKQQQNRIHEKKMAKEIEEIRSLVESIIVTIAQKEKEAAATQNALKELKEVVKKREYNLAEVKKAAESQERACVQSQKEAALLEKERHGVELSLAHDSSEKKGIENELEERHALSIHDLNSSSFLLEMNVEEASIEIQRLRSLLDSSGAVNMTAIVAFEETQERFEYLDKQLKDLEASKKDLEEIIATLDQESRKIFKSTFQQIRENFQKNFEILFTGGSADLTFTESGDILEAGVEIVAKPPGKNMRSINLLSGGEKCLTALALLFSIFEVRPAPFCILDEVDAPLDETNIERFTRLLREFTAKTQFVIVTHNKKTMAIADLLIGVSMEEKGVSKLISLAFEPLMGTLK